MIAQPARVSKQIDFVNDPRQPTFGQLKANKTKLKPQLMNGTKAIKIECLASKPAAAKEKFLFHFACLPFLHHFRLFYFIVFALNDDGGKLY